MTERIRQLEQFIADDPDDPFNFYALGLEYMNINGHKAVDIFEHLIEDHKDYLPSYYQLAKLYESFGQKENAIHTYNAGLIIAKKQQDLKTHRELSAGLQELSD